jgi:hypothetical protein
MIQIGKEYEFLVDSGATLSVAKPEIARGKIISRLRGKGDHRRDPRSCRLQTNQIPAWKQPL